MNSPFSVCRYAFIALFLSGCSESSKPAAVICTAPKQSKIWLLSEVDDSFQEHPDGSFRFPIVNQTNHPVSVSVYSIGCSCYQVKKGEARLKVDERFDLGAGATETLVLFPPRPVFDRVSDYNFSLGYEQKPGEPTSILSCQGHLTSIADMRVNPTVLTAEFVHDSPPQTVMMEVTRTARQRADVEHPITTSGWPEGTEVDAPTPVGEPTMVMDGLWKQTWRVSARIPKPQPTATPQEMWPIRVTGPSPDSPHNSAQLMIRFRSGLSGPRLVHFGEVQVGQPTSRRIQILARDEVQFRILGPSAPNEPLSLKTDTADAAKTHWGDLTMNANEPGEFRQILQVKTDHPQQATLPIEVRANVTAPVSTPEPADGTGPPGGKP